MALVQPPLDREDQILRQGLAQISQRLPPDWRLEARTSGERCISEASGVMPSSRATSAIEACSLSVVRTTGR